MTPEQVASTLQQVSQQSHDPVFTGLAWVLGILLMILALAKPFMGLVRQYRVDRADDARNKADEAVFERMRRQLEQNSSDIRALIEEKNRLYEDAFNLRIRVDQLEKAEATIERLKQKLDKKDEELRQRDQENRQLMLEIISLKDRIHQLEQRLSEDERRFCANCEIKKDAAA